MHTFLSFHVLKPPLCLTGSHPLAAIGPHPESSNTQAAAGHTIWTWPGVGILPDLGCRCDCCWGVVGGCRTVLQDDGCVIWRQRRINTPLLLSIHPLRGCGMMAGGQRGGGAEHTAVLSHYQWWMKPEQSINGMAGAHSFECVSVLVCVSYLTVCARQRQDRQGEHDGAWNIQMMQINHFLCFRQQVERNKRGNRLPVANLPVVWLGFEWVKSYQRSCSNCQAV